MSAEQDPPSKSSLKREADRLQSIGQRLTQLKQDQLDGLELPERLLHAIREYQRFGSREAKRRQLQFVGRVMRETDVVAITARLDLLDGVSAHARQVQHHIERWRATLTQDPDSLTAFVEEYTAVDRQQLRQLLKQIRIEQHPARSKMLNRELFRFIKQTHAFHEDNQA